MKKILWSFLLMLLCYDVLLSAMSALKAFSTINHHHHPLQKSISLFLILFWFYFIHILLLFVYVHDYFVFSHSIFQFPIFAYIANVHHIIYKLMFFLLFIFFWLYFLHFIILCSLNVIFCCFVRMQVKTTLLTFYVPFTNTSV